MNDDIIKPGPGNGVLTVQKEDISSFGLQENWRDLVAANAGVYDPVTDLSVNKASVRSEIQDVPLIPESSQIKVITSNVKISDLDMAISFNRSVDYDNSIKRQAAIKLMEQLLDEGFITFQKVATVKSSTILQARIIAIQQEDI